MKNIKISMLVLLMTYGCVGQNINNNPLPIPSVTPSIKSSPIVTPSSSVIPSVISSPVTTPVPTPIASITPIPSSTPSPTLSPIQIKNLSFGINEPFIRITNKDITDYQKESSELKDDLNAINAKAFIIDLNLELVDFESTKEGFLWAVYDNILEKFKDRQPEIYFRLNYRDVLGSNNINQRAKFLDFIKKAIERYKDEYNISWIIGDRINDSSSVNVSQKEFMNFLTLCVNNIRVFTPNAKIFLGSLVQSEIFAKNNYFTADNLLSYINLGAGKMCDGFIFEIYSLDITNKEQVTSSIFINTNYELIGKYYQVINDVLKRKNITNKQLFLISSTFGGEIVDQVKQSEEDQANDLFRRIIYSVSVGFDKFFLPQLYDNDAMLPSDFYKRIGIQIKDSGDNRKKISYWMYKFISDKLNNTKFTGYINNLPNNIKGFIFESDSKRYYILWNEIKTYTGTINLSINDTAGKIYFAPTEISKLGTSLDFTTQNNTKNVNVDFYSNPLLPRIIEVNK